VLSYQATSPVKNLLNAGNVVCHRYLSPIGQGFPKNSTRKKYDLDSIELLQPNVWDWGASQIFLHCLTTFSGGRRGAQIESLNFDKRRNGRLHNYLFRWGLISKYSKNLRSFYKLWIDRHAEQLLVTITEYTFQFQFGKYWESTLHISPSPRLKILLIISRTFGAPPHHHFRKPACRYT